MAADKHAHSQAQLCAKAVLASSFLQEVVSTTVNELLSNEEVLSAVTSAFSKLQDPPTALLSATAEKRAEDFAKKAEGKTNEEPQEESEREPQGEPQKEPEEKLFVSDFTEGSESEETPVIRDIIASSEPKRGLCFSSQPISEFSSPAEPFVPDFASILASSEPELIPEKAPPEQTFRAEGAEDHPAEALANVTSEPQELECRPQEAPVESTSEGGEAEMQFEAIPTLRAEEAEMQPEAIIANVTSDLHEQGSQLQGAPVESTSEGEVAEMQPAEALVNVAPDPQEPESQSQDAAMESACEAEEAEPQPVILSESSFFFRAENAGHQPSEARACETAPMPKCNREHTPYSNRKPGRWDARIHKAPAVPKKVRFADEPSTALASTLQSPKTSKSKRVKLCFRKLLASSNSRESIIHEGRKLLQTEIARTSEGLAVLRSKYKQEFMKEVDAEKAECLLCPEMFRFATYKWVLQDRHYQQHISCETLVCSFCTRACKLPLDLWQHFRICRKFEAFLAAWIPDKRLLTSIRTRMLVCQDDQRFLKQINNPRITIDEYGD